MYFPDADLCRKKMASRVCSKCSKEKSVTEFYGNRKDCKVCKKKQVSKNYNKPATKEKIKRHKNKPEVKNRINKRRQDNRKKPGVAERINTQRRENYKKPEVADKIKKRQQQYAKKNKEKIKKRVRTEKVRKQNRDRAKQKRSTGYGKLLLKIRNNLAWVIQIIKTDVKTGVTSHRKYKTKGEILLGCSIADFKKHIEKHWQSWMTWENYGKGDDKWSVDHTVPFNAFKANLKKYRKIVCWWQNTRPMRTPENESKHAKYTDAEKQSLIKRYLKRHN